LQRQTEISKLKWFASKHFPLAPLGRGDRAEGRATKPLTPGPSPQRGEGSNTEDNVEKETNRMGRRRTLDRKALRTDFDEAEERQEEEEEQDEEESEDEESEGEGDEEPEGEGEGEDEEGEVKPKAKPKAKKKAVKAPTKRSRAAKQVRMKVVWGVFNNSNQQVETFAFPEKAEADAAAERLSTDKKATFFVQLVKKPLEEKEK